MHSSRESLHLRYFEDEVHKKKKKEVKTSPLQDRYDDINPDRVRTGLRLRGGAGRGILQVPRLFAEEVATITRIV